jgi:hypothetical protein
VKLLDMTTPPAGRQDLEAVMLMARASTSCQHVVRLLGVSTVSIASVGSGRPATASEQGGPQHLALVMPAYTCNLTKHIEEQPGELNTCTSEIAANLTAVYGMFHHNNPAAHTSAHSDSE